jgi:hypothetical protein
MGWIPLNATKTWTFGEVGANTRICVIKCTSMAETVTTKDGSSRSRAKRMDLIGLHGSPAPQTARPTGVLIVGQTQAEAEANARQWADRR